jgi:non-canonical (house-cleaning) NTP pyrophosphatase
MDSMDRDTDIRNFWQKLQSGVEVAVAGNNPETLLGIRDAFLRFFHDGLDKTVSVVVVPQTVEGPPPMGLPVSDEETLQRARACVTDMESRIGGDAYQFYMASEGGIHSLELDGRTRYFVRNWTVVRCPLGEAWGSSGSVQLPDRLIEGLDSAQIPFAVPGTRRSGGMTRSLTGGIETRRKAIATSTLHAISTLFYGILERPQR